MAQEVGPDLHAVTHDEYGERLPSGLTPAEVAPLLIAVNDGLQPQWLLNSADVDIAGLFRAFLTTIVGPRAAGPPPAGR
ncbi:hypothetical protein [Sinosporangium siamense]|uniref:hypothetical protein n=1 Tax=Sinosporangium siamense TaxID=1367973 RepID=UPI00194E3E43|nr:hypothetical protein [Sinosporangium siamense]